MLADVDGGAAVFAADREALRHAQNDQQDRRENADVAVARQQADERRRQAHGRDGDEERVLAADDVADAAEHQRAERAHDEAGGEGQKREDVAGDFRVGAEEVDSHHADERAVEIEIVPLEDGAERRRADDANFARAEIDRRRRRRGRDVRWPLVVRRFDRLEGAWHRLVS